MTTIDSVATGSEHRNPTATAALVFGLAAIVGGATFQLGKALPNSMVFAVIQGILIAAPALWLIVVVLAITLGHVGVARAHRFDGAGRARSITAFILGYVALVPMAVMVWLTVSGLTLWGPWFGMLR